MCRQCEADLGDQHQVEVTPSSRTSCPTCTLVAGVNQRPHIAASFFDELQLALLPYCSKRVIERFSSLVHVASGAAIFYLPR